MPASIGSGTWTYQWSYSDDAVNYFPISGATLDSYTPPASRYYRVVATRIGASAELRLYYEQSSPYVQAISTVNATLDVTYTPSVTGVVGNGSWNYHWFFSPETGGAEQDKGVTSGPYTISAVDCSKRGYYRVEISDACGEGADAAAWPYLYVDNCQ